jgi:hypothetical protein
VRRTAAVAVVTTVAGLLAAPNALAARSTATTAGPQPVIALIDTGVRATHQEFDYRGPSSTTDQFVAWWDFTSEVKQKVVLPQPGQAWDTAVKDPYDKHGHGTGTAAMAVGRNAVSAKTPSALPGGKLAVAKVGTKDGTIEGDLAAAVRWATDTVHADVISMSIGTIVPVPAELFRDTYDAFAEARKKGVLVVVANGNGWGNVGVLPGDPGWASGYASSTNALAVGATGAAGLLVSTDPEVAANYSVTSAGIERDNAYVDEGGTSFSAPFVAGFAGALVKAAREAGRPVDPARTEQLVKYAATDTVVPPQFEGYGTLSLAELPAAQAHARAGTLPTRPSPDLSGMYVEQVAGTLRSAWSD